MLIDYEGKLALVTGAGQGLGRSIAKKLAQYGSTVIVTDVNEESAESTAVEIKDAGGTAEARPLDVSDWNMVEQTIGDVVQSHGAIGILVNNAGISRRLPLLETPKQVWDQIIGVNLTGVFATLKFALPAMIEAKYGRVVNIASISSKSALPDFSHYSASKFGVLGLTQAVAAEMAEHGITLNTVLPGVMDTPLVDQLIEELVARDPSITSFEEGKKWFTDMLPLGAPQPAEDVAQMVAYLSSDYAKHITAASFHVDGGMVPR